MGGCDTQMLAEHVAHPVCRAEAAVIGDGFERPVAILQQHASNVDTGPLDEFVRRETCPADKMSGEVARAQMGHVGGKVITLLHQPVGDGGIYARDGDRTCPARHTCQHAVSDIHRNADDQVVLRER